jgi:hypothetical protein
MKSECPALQRNSSLWRSGTSKPSNAETAAETSSDLAWGLVSPGLSVLKSAATPNTERGPMSKKQVDVEGFVDISLDDVASFGDYGMYLDHMSEKIGHPLLQNVDTRPVSINGDGTIKVHVTGYIEGEEDE